MRMSFSQCAFTEYTDAQSIQVSKFHKQLLEQDQDFMRSMGWEPENIPDNAPAEELADGLASGHNFYRESSAVVLVVVQEGERNIYDQR